jgi:ABC-type glycerol-3-phosphate transport system permease component
MRPRPHRSGDGGRGNRFRVFWHVTVPELRPVTVFMVVWQTITALQLFDLVYTTTRGGPLNSSQTIVYYCVRAGLPNATIRISDRRSPTVWFALTMVLTIGMILYSRRARGGGILMSLSADRQVGSRRRRLLPFSPWHLLAHAAVAGVRVSRWCRWCSRRSWTSADINRFPPRLIPTTLSLARYRGLFGQSHILHWLLNTVIVAAARSPVHLLLCSLAGYGFRTAEVRRSHACVLRDHRDGHGADPVAHDSDVSDVHAASGSPTRSPPRSFHGSHPAFGIFLMRQFFLSLPKELEEAAIA